jgi:hypothetical protein
METAALVKLRHRAAQLSTKLAFGTAMEIQAARELLRQSMVELYELGYWSKQPTQMGEYMRLFRASDASYISAPVSSSAPDRTVRCSP